MARTNLEQQLKVLDRLKARGVITEDEYQSRHAAALAFTEAAIAVKEGGSAAKGPFKGGFFEIPADAAVKWLRADPDIFLKNGLYFEAQ